MIGTRIVQDILVSGGVGLFAYAVLTAIRDRHDR